MKYYSKISFLPVPSSLPPPIMNPSSSLAFPLWKQTCTKSRFNEDLEGERLEESSFTLDVADLVDLPDLFDLYQRTRIVVNSKFLILRMWMNFTIQIKQTSMQKDFMKYFQSASVLLLNHFKRRKLIVKKKLTFPHLSCRKNSENHTSTLASDLLISEDITYTYLISGWLLVLPNLSISDSELYIVCRFPLDSEPFPDRTAFTFRRTAEPKVPEKNFLELPLSDADLIKKDLHVNPSITNECIVVFFILIYFSPFWVIKDNINRMHYVYYGWVRWVIFM